MALLVKISDHRSLPSRRPCSFKIWDEEESALVEEDQMRSPSFGVFLYAASGISSSVLFRPRPAAMPGARVSDNSTRASLVSSKHDRGDTRFRSAAGSDGRCASMSTGRWSNRRPQDHLPVVLPASTSWSSTTGEDVPEWVWDLSRPSRFFDNFATTGTRNSQTLLLLEQFPADSNHFSVAGWRAGDASPTALGCHMVSCIL